MPIVECLAPQPSPGRAFLRSMSATITDHLGIPPGHSWVFWRQVDAESAYRPEWEGVDNPAPVLFVTCKETYDRATLRGLLDKLQRSVAEELACRRDEVYIAVRRVAKGELLVRGEVWTGDSTAGGGGGEGDAFAPIEIRPIGVVRGPRGEASDDYWGGVESVIELDPSRFDDEALAELDSFSHLEVVFHFHKVAAGSEETGARHPRGNTDWPKAGIFAQRAKRRPNRLGVSRCRLVKVDGLSLTVEGLDAIDGTPIVDVKPYMREFDPIGEVRQPDWSSTVMSEYYADGATAPSGAGS